ncbi:MFS transporter [Bifidobacterium miconisargentati]|uniref:MFS transporter n=1 Tax=Bifidobacterium miconisargentati TaxID=2834437 RepID=UPI001BDCFF1C|nr:MFS transporter [Bifidobacterium miconisargentati]MBW3089543.1 MFS transporter [Bifidobacterium miconisargentati]
MNAGIGSADSERIPARLIGAIVAVGSLAFIGILTETVMTVLFPALMREFHVDTATVQWITTIYLLSVAATMPISSFLKRRFRLKAIFLAAVALGVVGSLIMIFATAFPLMIVARIIQGVGSGIATPLMINIILEQSPRSKIGRLMGVGSLVITVAPAIGPTVGGAVTSVLPWRAIFVIAVPLMLVAAVIGCACIEQRTPTEAAYLDPIQLGSIIIALVGLVLALNQGGVAVSAAVSGGAAMKSGIVAMVSLMVGLGALLLFAVSSKRAFSPLLRLGILRDPAVLLHALAYTLLPLVAIGYGYVITNVAQLSLGASAFVAGSLVLPGALVGAVCAPVGGWFYDKFGAVKPILIPLGIAILGPVLMLVFSMHLTPVMLAGFYFIFGFLYAIGNANVMTSGLSEVPHQFRPDGNAIFNTGLQFGGAAGTALFSTILAVAQAGAGEEGTPRFAHATAVGGAWTFATMIVICVIGWGCLATAFRIRARRSR